MGSDASESGGQSCHLNRLKFIVRVPGAAYRLGRRHKQLRRPKWSLLAFPGKTRRARSPRKEPLPKSRSVCGKTLGKRETQRYRAPAAGIDPLNERKRNGPRRVRFNIVLNQGQGGKSPEAKSSLHKIRAMRHNVGNASPDRPSPPPIPGRAHGAPPPDIRHGGPVGGLSAG